MINIQLNVTSSCAQVKSFMTLRLTELSACVSNNKLELETFLYCTGFGSTPRFRMRTFSTVYSSAVFLLSHLKHFAVNVSQLLVM